MHRAHDSLVLAPTDLSAFLGCRHRTGLDLAAAFGLLEKPVWTSAALQALQQRGAEHERRYVESLRASGLRVVEVETVTGATRDDGRPDVAVRVAATLEAMRAGADVIVQAALEHVDPGSGLRWRGFADILRRVETPSALGEWSYEAHDTKLARETRGGTILQLAAYSDMLARIQQMVPERFHVVTPHPKASSHAWPFAEHTFRFAEYAAYYRLVMKQIAGELARALSGVPRAAEAPAVEGAIEAAIEALRTRYYPEPVEQCDVCRWWDHCNARRRADDHLSFIANCGRVQRTELQSQGIATLAAAAAMSLPLPFRPSRGSAETYERIRDQARMQVRQRLSGKPEHELLLPVEPGFGLARLPAPSPGDLFLDLEAARFACEGGREYLFGLWSSDGVYRAWWAHDAVEERAAFDQVMHVIVGALDSDPNMHVYHFGHYEPSAFKRLMGRHALAADDLDRLLRGERFVNLLTVVRQALLAGVESYSIKQLEPLYEFTRDIDLREASANLQAIELALEAGTAEVIPEEVRAAVQGYNRDDCRSTQALRDWLERLRAELEAEGTSV
ncbi:MAG: TM0106 family RecB-like putative nuclease, partial [Vicinamibacteraceae bacterium]|nr:TM0106 family RecB-like putative nuclease [Vicinamibacteraceae bacterium]